MPDNVIDLGNGLKVRVLDEGTGPTLLLLHGNPDNADEWASLIRLLKGNFRCIAPDLPGYGRTGTTIPLPLNYVYSVDAQVSFVDTLLAKLNVQDKITLVVHDIGGIMGVPWAARNTQRLANVIFTNTVAYPNFKWFELAHRWGNPTPIGKVIAT